MHDAAFGAWQVVIATVPLEGGDKECFSDQLENLVHGDPPWLGD
jgi:hypothetical protein